MSKTTDHLSKLGYTKEDAYQYVHANLDKPSEIFKVCEKYDVTTEMLDEIMGDTASLKDVQNYMKKNGYDTNVLDLSTTDYIKSKGANVQEIHDQIILKMKSPAAVLALSKQYGLTVNMLDDILTEYNSNDISKYLSENHIDDDVNALYEMGSKDSSDDDDIGVVGTTTTVTTTTVV